MNRTTPAAARPWPVLALLSTLAAGPVGVWAQSSNDPGPRRIDGPPPPELPATINRDDRGNATVRAVRLDAPIRLDGVLDERLYSDVRAISGFLQSVPDEGAPATEQTEAWVAFDDDAVYVSARIWDSAPESEWVANELRRDTDQLRENDTFGVLLDTFYDRRNAVMFYTNPLGALAEFAITNEGNPNKDWNPVWDVRTGRFEDGWTVEMRIPFKSLRYRPGTEQIWGIQMRRAIRRKNEWTHLTLIPRSAAGSGAMGVFRVSASGTLVGLQVPPASRVVELKPYAIAGLETDITSTPETRNDPTADAGLDLKVGITDNLTADFTYNTDFAQVEVDEQQVNLSRFSLFFPEKREFFLEGRGIFDFASPGVGGGGGGGGGPGRFGGGSVRAPTMFFSRRIGLEGGEPVPIVGGGRVTGKVGAFDVGALAIQTDDRAAIGAEATHFGVLRLRRDVLARSNVGVLLGNRSESALSSGSNQTYGIDGTFRFYENLDLLAYYAQSRTGGLTGLEGLAETGESYRGRVSWDGDLVGAEIDHLLVDGDFSPEVGFVPRRGFRQSFGSARYSPRPASLESVRQVTFEGRFSHLRNDSTGVLESREWQGSLRLELENSDRLGASFSESYENVLTPFAIAPGVEIPTGRYGFRDVRVSYNFGLQRPYSGNLSVQRGSFYGGSRTSVGFQRARVEILPQLSLEPGISFNWLDLPGGDFGQHVAVTRVNYSFSPRMFLSGLLQYNSGTDTFSTNVRLRWEFAPGSEVFVVYTEDRDTDVFDRFSELSTRGLSPRAARCSSCTRRIATRTSSTAPPSSRPGGWSSRSTGCSGCRAAVPPLAITRHTI